jgi:L-serine dehydratase
MQQAIAEGLKQTKILPGKIGYARKAKLVYDSKSKTKNPLISCTDHKLMAYAYASSEQNAGGGVIVTAPTCGSCGVLPAVLLSAQQQLHLSNQKIHEALAVAGLIGNITRTNATIAGAQAGCQAEIGVASAMAAAAYAHILGLSDKKIMNAATNALEHHLGLTCDPVLGYVQVPCIERNVFAARQAITSASLCTYTNEAQM